MGRGIELWIDAVTKNRAPRKQRPPSQDIRFAISKIVGQFKRRDAIDSRPQANPRRLWRDIGPSQFFGTLFRIGGSGILFRITKLGQTALVRIQSDDIVDCQPVEDFDKRMG